MPKQSYVILADSAFIPVLEEMAPSWQIIPLAAWDVVCDQLPAHIALLVVARPFLDTALLAQVESWCEQQNISWCSFHLEQQRGWLGPLVIPHKTANYTDLLARRLAVAESEAAFHALTAPPYSDGEEQPLPHAELVWMLSVLLTELERWSVGDACRLVGSEVEADPRTLSLMQYPFLPLPEHVTEAIYSPIDLPTALVNPRSGVIIRTVEAAHMSFVPPTLKTVQAHVAYMGWHTPIWQNDTICGGSVFLDAEAARQAAIGEAVERYCSTTIGQATPLHATYNELVACGEHAVDPEQLILFAPEVCDREDCSLVPFRRDTLTYWVLGRSLSRDCPAWLPMSLVYFNWDRVRFGDQPLTNWANYAGVAAGASLEQALVSGIEELIERDSTMIWWYNRQPLPALIPTPELMHVWDELPDEHPQRAWVIPIPNEFNIPVMAGVVEHTAEQLLTIGFACRPNPLQAAFKAWSEALILEESAYDLLQADGRTYRAVNEGWLPNVLKPWRADRAYLDSYRADFQDVTHLMMQLQVGIDPKLISSLRPWVDVSQTYALADIPALPDRTLATYRQRLESRGYEIFYIDITLPDIALTGMRTTRVIVPGLVPNTPAAFPPLGNGRIQQMAVQLGWRLEPLPVEELNYLPMPHA